MDTNNQSQTGTGNPQNVGIPESSQGTGNLQDTVPENALDQPDSQGLSVQQTGEPLDQQAAISSPGSFNAYFWVLILGIIIAVGVFLLIKLLKESSEEAVEPLVEEAANQPRTVKTKKTSKKKANKKKSSPNQRRKNTSKRKR